MEDALVGTDVPTDQVSMVKRASACQHSTCAHVQQVPFCALELLDASTIDVCDGGRSLYIYAVTQLLLLWIRGVSSIFCM